MRLRALAFTLSTGCSFVFVRPPPARPIDPSAKVECTQSRAAPVVDLVLGMAGFAVGAAGLTASKPRCESTFLCLDFSGMAHVVGAITIGLGAVAIGSSVFGFSRTAACDAIHEGR
jgi:hypothetical protein